MFRSNRVKGAVLAMKRLSLCLATIIALTLGMTAVPMAKAGQSRHHFSFKSGSFSIKHGPTHFAHKPRHAAPFVHKPLHNRPFASKHLRQWSGFRSGLIHPHFGTRHRTGHHFHKNRHPVPPSFSFRWRHGGSRIRVGHPGR